MSKFKISRYRVSLCMGKCSTRERDSLSCLSDSEFEEFNHIGYTGKDLNGKRTSHENFLNTLNKGQFEVETLSNDNSEFTAELLIIRVH